MLNRRETLRGFAAGFLSVLTMGAVRIPRPKRLEQKPWDYLRHEPSAAEMEQIQKIAKSCKGESIVTIPARDRLKTLEEHYDFYQVKVI